MAIADMLLPEFDHEMATTRKLLERVPEGQFGWKPHGKSFSLGQLAQHVATLPSWGQITLQQTEFDVAANPQHPPVATRAALLELFDRNSAATRQALVDKTDAELMAPWALKSGAVTVFSMPKVTVWRSFVMNHLVHHRGQLSVYLRLQDVPVPAMYGPSADEQPS
jgi:uncharacterized damage-inducible protein DinB